ncbi:MAG: PDZ domain-containing protein [Gammaproteobacteria bacterium]|nr:PDZ domain-containing protein [Gammaproteobacteria bacterium]
MRLSVSPARIILVMIAHITLLAGCVSYEPRVLVPAVTLSPEDISLRSASNTSGGQLNFGLEVTVNESDSLLNVATLPGIRVRTVNSNGAADAAGIQPGDIILSVNAIATNHPDTLAALSQQSEGGSFQFTVRRNTAVLETTLTAVAASTAAGPRELYRADPIATRAGYRTEMVNIREQASIPAARVTELFPDSPLPAAGIKPGDLVLALNGTNLNSAQDLITRLNQEFALGTKVEFTVFDGDAVETKTVTLWNPGRRISRISLGPMLKYESSLSPSSDSLTLLDLWLFAVYRYNRVDGEKSHNVLGLIKYSSNYGELTETAN